MTVVRVNAITVPDGGGDEVARRFASRAGAVDQADGFEGFELLRPTDGRERWLVVTRWRDDDAFQAWVASPAFAHGHRPMAERSDTGRDEASPPGTHPRAGAHEHGRPGQIATASELWSYDVVELSR